MGSLTDSLGLMLTDEQRRTIDNAMLAFSGDPESDMLLSEIGAKNWRMGGCYALSLSLRDILEGSVIVALGVDGEGPSLAHHTLVSFRGCYIDSEGCHSAEDILSEFRKLSDKVIAMFDPTTSTVFPKGGEEYFQGRLYDLISSFIDPSGFN